MRPRILGAAILSAIVVSEAAAQGSGPSSDAAPSPPAENSGPSSGAAANDPHLAKALEFISVSGSRELMIQRANLMFPLVVQLVRQQVKSGDAAFWSDVEKLAKEEVENSADDLLKSEARIYAAHFSDGDLDALIAFYKSDVGKKYLSERSKIVDESTAVGIAWGEKMGAVLSRRVMDKLHQSQKGRSL